LLKTALFSILTISAIQATECRLVNNQGIKPNIISGKKLSVFWSQEYSGTDLVKEEIESVSWAKNVYVSVFDSGFEQEFIKISKNTKVDSSFFTRNRKPIAHHGTSVANIINGKGLYDVSNKVEYLGLRNVKFSAVYGSEFKRYETIGIFPKIISNSYGWKDYEAISNLSISAKEKNILWFLASGNDYPLPISDIENYSGALLVGSHAPSGLQSSFSQISNNVITLAGGDDYQASIDGNGKHINFGGTSGATPLVAGSIVNIASLIPNITYEQTKKLIQKTNLPSFESSNGFINNPGIFNAYKAYEVAKKIAEHCQNNENPNNENCISEELLDEDNYNFNNRIQYAPNENDILDKSISCEQRQENLKELRRISLLINTPTLWEKLETVYNKLGYTKNSEYYKNLKNRFEITSDLILEMEQGALNALKNERYFEAYFRYQDYFSDNYQIQLANLLITEQSPSKYWVTHFLKELKGPLSSTVRNTLEKALTKVDSELAEYIKQVLNKD